jgi:hypothetical protein
MRATRALKAIRRLASEGLVKFTQYGERRRAERAIATWDVIFALAHAVHCRLQGNGRWWVLGEDSDRAELKIVVEIRENVIVVNTFRGDEE